VTAVTALAACVAGFLLVVHAVNYFFLFDDFALIGIAGGTPWQTLATTPQIGFFRPFPFGLMRAEFSFLGWTHPPAYAVEALLVHVVNACLVGVLAVKVGVKRPLALTAAVVFFLSAASAEGYFWLSSTFDRFCVLGTLIALMAGLFFASAPHARMAIAAAFVGVGGTALAVLSKESGVVVPVLALLTFTMTGLAGRRRAISYIAIQLAIVLPLLAYRQYVLPGFNGAYGSLASLFAHADLATNVRLYATSVFRVPLPWHDTTWMVGRLSTVAWMLSAASWLAIIVTLGAKRPIVLASGLLAALASIAPVAWVAVLPGTTASGRFLYLPGVWLALVLVLALDAASRAPTRVIASTSAVIILVVQSASVQYQARIWRLASQLSHRTMLEMQAYRNFERPLYIENMPAAFIEGPFVLKDYAFAVYFGPTFKPRVRARGMELRVVEGRAVGSGWLGPDDRLPEERAVQLHSLDGTRGAATSSFSPRAF